MAGSIRNPNLGGLSDFGLLQPSVSGASDAQVTPDLLKKMLGTNEILDSQARADMLDQYLNQNQSVPSTLDRLKSPQGLLSLLLTGLAGAVGGPAAAAGAGLGALEGANAAKEADVSALRTAREQAQKERDAALERVDKAHQRITTLLQSNPELFVDPQTGQQTVPPETLGFYATGAPMPIFASTRRIMERRDKAWQERNDLLVSTLDKTTSTDDAKKVLSAWFANMDYTAPEDLVNTLANSIGTPQMTTDAFNTFLKYGGASGLDATIYAGENHLSPFDPRVLAHLKFQDPDASTKKITPSDRALQLAQEINAWQQDPANLDTLRSIATTSKTAEEKSTRIAQEALGGRDADLRLYLHEMGLHDPSEWQMLMTNFNLMKQKYQLGIGMSGIDQLPVMKNMTPDEQNQWLWQQAQSATDAQQQAQLEDQAKQDVAAVNGIAQELQKGLGVTPDVAGQEAANLAKIARDRATRPDGRVDRVRFGQELKQLSDQAIKAVKGGQ